MAQKQRQTKLFAAEDYTVAYESYVNANFQAYDYDTIRTAMVEYLRNNYPENYNDWIESAEFVSLLDVIAQFGHSLAYRVDLNARNNFLTTSQRKEAVLNLADFLGYQPVRNIAASGLLKVVGIKTNESVIGGDGVSLAGQEIRFENTTGPDNLDNFIAVINAVFNKTNQFGSPEKQAIIDGVTTQFYSLNNTAEQVTFPITGNINGETKAFDVFGLQFDSTTKSIVESNPNPSGKFSVVYKNDGRGIGSEHTGFFVGVSQGSIDFRDFLIDNQIASQGLDINVNNINQTDVWLQNINAQGEVLKQWSRVDNAYGNNETFNTINNGIRDIFSVRTRNNNQITVRFPDETFGNIPTGNVRVWYRTSNNESYIIRPDDISNQNIKIDYVGGDGNTYTASLVLSLKSSITNASGNETLDDIKQKAPRVFASQDRMITADDYNGYLYSQSNSIRKIKSVNRTFSGHSRYINMMDPTGAYTNLNIFGTDGSLSKTNPVKLENSNNANSKDVFNDYISKIPQDDEFVNLYYDLFKDSFESIRQQQASVSLAAVEFTWNQQTLPVNNITTGYFVNDGLGEIDRTGSAQVNYLRYVTVGSLLKFTLPSGEVRWALVTSIFNNGLGVDNTNGNPSGTDVSGKGAIVLDNDIPSGSSLDMIYPALNRSFSNSERNTVIAFLDSKRDFEITYDYYNNEWLVNDRQNNILQNPELDVIPNSFDNETWVVYVNYNPATGWNIYYRTQRYTIESTEVNFSNLTNQYKLQEESNKKKRDQIRILNLETNLFDTFYLYGYDTDGKVIISLVDANSDSRPDNPELFKTVSDAGTVGRRFEWVHVPAENEIVDPSFTNLIDVFVLTRAYDTEFREWLVDSENKSQPLAPTVSELNKQFLQINNKKAMSDKIIYRPVKYKPLFGIKAEDMVQAKFRVVKLLGTTQTDSEIKTKIVSAIGEFFDLNNWDFGETFYFTELSAFVHKKMSGIISSFVIVPLNASSVFGDLFEVSSESDELFIPDISVGDIDIIDSNTSQNIRSNRG